MFFTRLTIVLLFFVTLYGCYDENPAAGTMGSGRTPEWAVQNYQRFVDQNQFEAAKELSTPAEQVRLDRLAAIMVRESSNETILKTDFLQINCDTEGKVTYCQCLVEDQYERYEMVFKLVWNQNQWLIDAPDSSVSGEEEVLDEVLKGMKEMIQ